MVMVSGFYHNWQACVLFSNNARFRKWLTLNFTIISENDGNFTVTDSENVRHDIVVSNPPIDPKCNPFIKE